MNTGNNIMIAAALLVVAAPAYAQTAPAAPADFTSAAVAEVRNAQGQVILTGKFAVHEEDDDDTERKAPLTATSAGAGASGEAEVEISGTGAARKQEVEFAVKGVQPGATYTFVIDGKVVATVTADSKGRAAHERDVPLPGAAGTR